MAHAQESGTRNLHRIEHSSIWCKFLVPETFKIQPTNQATQFWYKKLEEVSGTRFLSTCPPPPLD